MTLSITNKLKSLSKLANHHQHKLSALVLYKGRPISWGFNDQFKTHPKIKKFSEHQTLHAETSALFRIGDKTILKHCTIVVYREDRHGNLACAKPCSTCQAILKHYGLKSMTYSTPEGFKEEKL